jgi:hydrogenase maturation protease
MKRILVAGIGNIFHGDDGFGVEVAQRLSRRPLTEGATVTDFGIRTYDLAYALTENYHAVILVDALQRGQPPGTVFLLEPEPSGDLEGVCPPVDGHGMNPAHALQLAAMLGGCTAKIYLVGCEPAVLESEEIGLSHEVEAAIPAAIQLVESLIHDLSATPAHELAL